MAEFDTQLAESFLKGMNPILGTPHPQTYTEVLLAIITRLAGTLGNRLSTGIPMGEYEGIRDAVVREQQSKSAPRDIDSLLVGPERYAVLTTTGGEPGQLRASIRGDLQNDAMFCGQEMIRAAGVESVPLRRKFAHNHLLLFPEILPLLPLFDTPQTRSVIKAKNDHFVFGRKLNDTVTTFITNECQKLRILRIAGGGDDRVVLAPRLPAHVVAYLVVQSYLKETGYKLDVGVECDRISTALAYCGLARETLADSSWQADLRQEGVVRFEMAGAQVRLTTEGFLWVVAHRLVEPLDVARVLVARGTGAKAALRAIRDRLQQRIDEFDSLPVNRTEYLSTFNL